MGDGMAVLWDQTERPKKQGGQGKQTAVVSWRTGSPESALAAGVDQP